MSHNQKIIDDARDVPCADCGGRFHKSAMDFDHLDGEQKSFGISGGAIRTTAVLLAEIAKCEVVCANCHRVRTYNRAQMAVERGDYLNARAPIDFIRAAPKKLRFEQSDFGF